MYQNENCSADIIKIFHCFKACRKWLVSTNHALNLAVSRCLRPLFLAFFSVIESHLNLWILLGAAANSSGDDEDDKDDDSNDGDKDEVPDGRNDPRRIDASEDSLGSQSFDSVAISSLATQLCNVVMEQLLGCCLSIS